MNSDGSLSIYPEFALTFPLISPKQRAPIYDFAPKSPEKTEKPQMAPKNK